MSDFMTVILLSEFRLEVSGREVDFMLKDSDISPDLVIFEIDGSSHFANEEAYTQHLQKDRWLRKQGWEVIRISNLEVDTYSDFGDFFEELTGKYIGIPF